MCIITYFTEHNQMNAFEYECLRFFFSTTYIAFFSWPAILPDMPPTEHVWDFVDWCLARNTCPIADTANFIYG